MNRYQLAKLVDWAETVDSRKRMQKVVFMLQAAGCEFDADYILHRFGPYSPDVAQLTDEMVQAKLLKESARDNRMGGTQYVYQLTDSTSAQLQKLDDDPRRARYERNMQRFEPLAKRLFQAKLWDLEVASTIVFYRRQRLDRPTASEKAFAFKKVDGQTADARRMEELADVVLPY